MEFGCFDASGFKGGKMKRSMATGKNGKFVYFTVHEMIKKQKPQIVAQTFSILA